MSAMAVIAYRLISLSYRIASTRGPDLSYRIASLAESDCSYRVLSYRNVLYRSASYRTAPYRILWCWENFLTLTVRTPQAQLGWGKICC